jgi:hypothetical protein
VVAWPRRRHPVGVLPATRLLLNLKAHARWRWGSGADGGLAPPSPRYDSSCSSAAAWRSLPQCARRRWRWPGGASRDRHPPYFVSHAIIFLEREGMG